MNVWQKASAKYSQQREAILTVVGKESRLGHSSQTGSPYQTMRYRNGIRTQNWRLAFIGDLLCSRIRNEWYPRQMYIEGSGDKQASRRDLRPCQKVWIQGFHSSLQA